MTDIWIDFKLILALHLTDHEILVESICARQQEQLCRSARQKLVGQASEPPYRLECQLKLCGRRAG